MAAANGSREAWARCRCRDRASVPGERGENTGGDPHPPRSASGATRTRAARRRAGDEVEGPVGGLARAPRDRDAVAVGVAGGLGGLEVLHDREDDRPVVRDEPCAQGRGPSRARNRTGPRAPQVRLLAVAGDDGDRPAEPDVGAAGQPERRERPGEPRRPRGSAGRRRGPSCRRSGPGRTRAGRRGRCPRPGRRLRRRAPAGAVVAARGGERCGEAGVDGGPARRGPGPRAMLPCASLRRSRCSAAAAAHAPVSRTAAAVRGEAVDGAVDRDDARACQLDGPLPGVVAEPGRHRRPAPASRRRQPAPVRSVDDPGPSPSCEGTAAGPVPSAPGGPCGPSPGPSCRGERPVLARGRERARPGGDAVERYPDQVRQGRGLRGATARPRRRAGRRGRSPTRGSAC